jgi:hypothetical protein
MPTELISLLGGGVTGFLFRYWAQRAQDQKDMFKMVIEANKQTKTRLLKEFPWMWVRV